MSDDVKARAKKLNDLRAQLDKLGYGDGRLREGQRPTVPARRKGIAVDDLRRTIRRQKQAQAPRPVAVAPEAITYSRNLPRRETPASRQLDPSRTVRLEDAVQGVEVVTGQRGKVFVVTTRVSDVEDAAPLSNTFRDHLSADDSPLRGKLGTLCGADTLNPSDFAFVDVESTGLGSSPLFLIGTMLWESDGFAVHQYLARDYAEEAAAIDLFVDTCSAKKVLVTFNGKSFDMPFIRTRCAANGIPFSLDPAHFDLLHECRRVWKAVLPDCKLQTLERFVCRRERHGDIPGSEIPDAYHEFVRTANACQMVEILKHNMLDLVTLADLMTKFPRPDPPTT